MLNFPIEREYGYRRSRKQQRKQRINQHRWWDITDLISPHVVFDKRSLTLKVGPSIPLQ